MQLMNSAIAGLHSTSDASMRALRSPASFLRLRGLCVRMSLWLSWQYRRRLGTHCPCHIQRCAPASNILPDRQLPECQPEGADLPEGDVEVEDAVRRCEQLVQILETSLSYYRGPSSALGAYRDPRLLRPGPARLVSLRHAQPLRKVQNDRVRHRRAVLGRAVTHNSREYEACEDEWVV